MCRVILMVFAFAPGCCKNLNDVLPAVGPRPRIQAVKQEPKLADLTTTPTINTKTTTKTDTTNSTAKKTNHSKTSNSSQDNSAETPKKAINKPKLLHFTAKWCRPCQFLNQMVYGDKTATDRIEEHYDLQIVDIDLNRPLANQYKISTIPTDVILWQDGTITTKPCVLGRSDYLNSVIDIAKQREKRK